VAEGVGYIVAGEDSVGTPGQGRADESKLIPIPICSVTPGARNFNGASRKEIATTMPIQRNVTAVARGDQSVTAGVASSAQ
jgi:hypothetical protein